MTMAKVTTKTKKPADAPAPAPALTAFKGFDADFKCRGYQFEVGGSYSVTGKIKCCSNGFHSCETPFDVWNYYGPIGSRFAVVEASGEIARHVDDSKIASASIAIKAELSLPEFIKRAIDWVVEATKGKDESGNYAQIGSSGYSAKIGSSGDYAQIGSSGYSAKIGSSGDYAQIGSSGYSAQISSSGDYAKIGSSGYSAKIGSSGNYAKIGSSGDYAQISSSGNYAQIGSSGDSAQISSSGDSAQIESTGENAVIASSGIAARAKGAEGTWIALAEFDAENKCIGFAIGRAGNNGVPADVWLVAKDGKLVAE